MDFWLAASHSLYSVYGHTWQYRETIQSPRYRMPPRNLRKWIGWWFWLWHCGVECGDGLIAKTCGRNSPRQFLGIYFKTPKVFNFELGTFYCVTPTSPQPYQSRWRKEVYIWRIFNVGLHPLVSVQPVNCRFPAFYLLGILLCLGRLLGLVWNQGLRKIRSCFLMYMVARLVRIWRIAYLDVFLQSSFIWTLCIVS